MLGLHEDKHEYRFVCPTQCLEIVSLIRDKKSAGYSEFYDFTDRNNYDVFEWFANEKFIEKMEDLNTEIADKEREIKVLSDSELNRKIIELEYDVENEKRHSMGVEAKLSSANKKIQDKEEQIDELNENIASLFKKISTCPRCEKEIIIDMDSLSATCPHCGSRHSRSKN
jgi:predicted RNA-binding Zn-ribbon protein involved in translation (DUF1610 family)